MENKPNPSGSSLRPSNPLPLSPESFLFSRANSPTQSPTPGPHLPSSFLAVKRTPRPRQRLPRATSSSSRYCRLIREVNSLQCRVILPPDHTHLSARFPSSFPPKHHASRATRLLEIISGPPL